MRKGYRLIVVDDIEYEWVVGRRFVNIVAPEGIRKTPTIEEVTGLSSDEVERAIWKRYLSITPQQIRDYILRTEVE